MKRGYAKIFIPLSLLAALIIIACPAKRMVRKDKGRMAVLASFDHKQHREYFKKEKIICANCHYMQLSLKGKTVKEAADTSQEFMYPAMEECHYCHNNRKFMGKIPQKCILCHQDSDLIIPDNHKFNWILMHKNISRTDRQECQSCHSDNYCNDCHLKRDTVRQRMHDRNFIFQHSIEARANPRKCVTCHSADYCKTCHTERGVTQ